MYAALVLGVSPLPTIAQDQAPKDVPPPALSTLAPCGEVSAPAVTTVPNGAAPQSSPPGQEEAKALPKAAPPAPRLTTGGSVSFHSVSNLNEPFNGQNQLRSFDFQDEHGPHFNLIDLWAQYAREPVGFRLDLNWGPAARIQTAAEPRNRDLWAHIQQVYVSANLDGKRGQTYVDFGKWSTPAGLEVVEAKDNVFYSPGLLFSWSPPFYHFGGRVFHNFNASDYVMAAVERGWNAVSDPGHAPGFILSGSKAVSPKWTVTGSYLGGEENDPFGRAHWRHLLDVIAVDNASPQWTYQLNAEYGRQANVKLAAELLQMI